MAKKSCAIIPRVFNKEGQKVDSRLFKDLLSFTGNDRDISKKIYDKTKTEEFIKIWNPKLTLDDNNEPTMSSLLQKTNIRKFISEEQILEKLNRDIGYYKKGQNRSALYINTPENFEKLTSKAIEFNSTSEYREDYVARVIRIDDKESRRESLGVKIYRRNKQYSIEANEMEYNAKLNSKLRDILAKYNISIGALTELEQRLGINGVTDFEQAKVATNGIIELIRLAEGDRGEVALPEEFAHFAIEAMGDNPLINRFIDYLNSKGLVKEILEDNYDSYVNLYGDNEYKLAKEAAGKLLAKHLIRNESTENVPHKNLLSRVISAIKNFFKNIGTREFTSAMYQADKEFGLLAKNLLEGNLDDTINIKNIVTSDKFYQVNSRVERDKKVLENIINTEKKRLQIYKERTRGEQFENVQNELISKLESKLQENEYIEGVYMFLDDALGTLKKVAVRLSSIQTNSSMAINEKASILRDIRNYNASYGSIIENVRKALLDEEKLSDNRYGTKIRLALKDVSDLIKDLNTEYAETAMPLFVDFIKPFTGEVIEVPFGKLKGKKITVENLVEEAHKDISLFDMWLDSMADSSDGLLRVFDQAVKKSKEIARVNTIEIKKKLEAATLKLEQAGIKSTDWMFEKDSKGNLSGDYISDINSALFREKEREMNQRLENKYGKYPAGEDADRYHQEKRDWYDSNLEYVGSKRLPKKSIYGNSVFTNLNKAQREYYNTIMEIKSQLDALLPESYTYLNNAVKIRKDLLERLKSSKDVKSGVKQLWESIKDSVIQRSDDTDFGSKSTLIDFEEHKVQLLPIYYIKMKEGESLNDMSTDITSTLTAYASMANDYKEMGKIIHVLEIGRDLMRERDVKQVEGDKELEESYTILGTTIKNVLKKKGKESNIMKRLDYFFDMQVYQRFIKDEGTFGKTNISKAKAADAVNKLTAINNLAFNVLAGTSNVLVGKIMMRTEALAKEFFTEKDVIKADRIYGTELPTFLSELGNRVKISKLALWNEHFNVMQDYDTEIKHTDFNKKTWFSRMFNTSSLFFINNAGEHWMQTRTSLALASNYKMKAPNGKIVNLWDAMEVVYIDPNNKKLGAKLQVKKGYTKEDGTEFTQDDVFKFTRKSAALNQRMHGIYNKEDRNAAQNLAIGRMAIMYRKWIKPSLNRRFKSATYNYDLEAWVEGYYNTTGRFLWQTIKELKDCQFNIVSNFKNLTKQEKTNIARAVIELSHFGLVALFMGLLEGLGDDDDDTWLVRMAEYQSRRLYTELGAMIPVFNINEGFKILKSPAAGINTIEKLIDLLKLLNPFNYNDEIQSGKYKGHSTAYKTLFESPVIPIYKTIHKSLHPEELLQFYKQ